MKKDFYIPNILDSLRIDYAGGKIAAAEVAGELHRAGWCNFIPDTVEALEMIGAIAERKEQTASSPEQHAIATREKSTAPGLAYVFNSILDEPARSVRI